MNPRALPRRGLRTGGEPVRITGRPVLVVIENPSVAEIGCGDDPGALTAQEAAVVLGGHHTCPPDCRPRAGALSVLAEQYRAARTANTAAPGRVFDSLDHQLAELVRQWLAAVE